MAKPAAVKVVRYLPAGETLDSEDPTSLFEAYYRVASNKLRVKYRGDHMKWGLRTNMLRLRLARWLLWRDREHFDAEDFKAAYEELDENIRFAVRLGWYDKYGL